MSACEYAGCARARYKRTWCRSHYKQFLSAGAPFRPIGPVGGVPIPMADRFWGLVDKEGPLILSDRCWVWISGVTRGGYGIVTIRNGSTMRAHRASWLLANGDPGDLHVLHRCDNPPCVRPDHLFLGTNADNIADRAAKGRTLRGESHPGSVLTESAVATIRRRLAAGDRMKDIALDCQVSDTAIGDIAHGRTWKET